MSSSSQSPRPLAAWLPATNQIFPSPPQTPVQILNGQAEDEVSESPLESPFTSAPSTPSPTAKDANVKSTAKSVEQSAASQVFRKSIEIVSRAGSLLTADDPGVRDKWAFGNISGGTFHSPSQAFDLEGDAKIPSSLAGLRQAIEENRRPAKLMLRQYGQGLLHSMFTAAINVPLVYALSRITWHVEHPGEQPAITLNQQNYQLSLLMQCVFPLALYSLVLYACIKSTWRIPKPLLAFVGIVMVLAIAVAILFWKYNVPFWFYSGDFLYIALTYVPSMCCVGYFLGEEGSTTRERLSDLMMIAVLETIVAAAALLYCMYLMPTFFMLSAWVQLGWMCIIHPVYFEITTAFLLRMVLRRNALKGRHNVLWFLSIVHASVHSVSISCILTSSIDEFGITVLTQVLCSAVKLVWRSTTNMRDLWAERLGKRDFTFTYTAEEQAVQNRMIAVGIQTEMILENASNVLAPWLIWCTWHVPLFMSLAPTQLVSGGTYPAYYVVCLILTLVAVTATFDLIFLFMNYHSWQQLPLIQTWREIRKAGWWYFGFLTYALTFMGFMFLFITMILVPRAVFCSSNNYCDCRLPTLQGICDGDFISTWGGNIM